MLGQLQDDATDALENLRDLARGIYPPLLADQGLAAALEAQARKSRSRVDVEADGVGRYPQEVEAAVYFCCLEALQNVAKYAEASHGDVRLADGSGDARVRGDRRRPRVRSRLDRLRDRAAGHGRSTRRLGRVAGGAKHAGAGNDRRGTRTSVVGLDPEPEIVAPSRAAPPSMRETLHHVAVLDLRLRRRRSRIPGARDRASSAVSRRPGAESPFLPPR